jgi:hypothetical protein
MLLTDNALCDSITAWAFTPVVRGDPSPPIRLASPLPATLPPMLLRLPLLPPAAATAAAARDPTGAGGRPLCCLPGPLLFGLLLPSLPGVMGPPPPPEPPFLSRGPRASLSPAAALGLLLGSLTLPRLHRLQQEARQRTKRSINSHTRVRKHL